MKPRTLYSLLNLDPLIATEEQIRTAYKKEALKRHPDKGGSDEAFSELQNAYEATPMSSESEKVKTVIPLKDTILINEKNYLFLEKHKIDLAYYDRRMQEVRSHLDKNIKFFIPELCAFLNENPEIKHLKISQNQLDDEHAEHLSKLKWIETLEVYQNNIGPRGSKFLSENKVFKKVSIWGNQLGPEGAKYFAMNNTIEELNIMRNDIGDDGAISFKDNTTIKTLILNKNRLTAKTAIALADMALDELNLSDNDIRDEGALALAKSTKIRRINLRLNNISNLGAAPFRKNTTIEELTIMLDKKDNDISDELAEIFFPFIGRSPVRKAQKWTNKVPSLINMTLFVVEKKPLHFSVMDSRAYATTLLQKMGKLNT